MQKDTPRDAGQARESSLSLQVNRCPFCHEGLAIATDEWVACRQCLARHHEACWTEGARCASCGHEHVLSVVATPVGAPTIVRRAPTTVQLLGHGLEGVGRVAWALLRLPIAIASVVGSLLGIANAWPRLTGVVVALVLLALVLAGGRTTRTVVYRETPTYTYQEPAPAVKTPRQRAREAAARGEFGLARLELERLARDSTDATVFEDLGWACLAEGLPIDARLAYGRAHELDPSQRRWGEVFAAAALGDRARALESLGSSLSVNDPAYRELWRAVLGGDRAGLSASAAPSGSWQAELVRWGRGELDDAGLLDAAERWPASPSAAERRCEAHAYVALGADLRGERDLALVHYGLAVDTSVFSYIEFVWASARLRALQGGGPALGALAAPTPTAQPEPEQVVPPVPPPPAHDGWGDDWDEPPAPAPEPQPR